MMRLLVAFASMLVCCHGHALGPPIEACGDMFPQGHESDARGDASPFTMTVNATSYSPGDVIKVFLDTSQAKGDYFMEGVFIQMRPVSCMTTSVGSFSIETGDKFLKTMDCFDKPKSALRHYSHMHIYNRTFYWKAPSAPSGHLYLRATVARNQKNFWTNVFSNFILDVSVQNASSSGLKNCPVRSKTNVGVSIAASGSVVVFAAAIVSIFVTTMKN